VVIQDVWSRIRDNEIGDADTIADSDVSLTSNTHAEQVAVQLWRMFGPVQQDVVIPRPFGSSVIDGVDFDVEGT
jgi:hypothetical protein